MRDELAQDILTARLRANAERRNGDELAGRAWDAEADDIERRMLILEQRAEWDLLADNRHG